MRNRYYSYLLRLFQTGSPGTALWRVSLQDSRSLDVLHFDSLLELCQYLIALTGADPAQPDASLTAELEPGCPPQPEDQ